MGFLSLISNKFFWQLIILGAFQPLTLKDKDKIANNNPNIAFQNRMGGIAMNEGKLGISSKHFSKALAENPAHPLSRFNWSTNKLFSSIGTISEEEKKQGKKPTINRELVNQAKKELKRLKNENKNLRLKKILGFQTAQSEMLSDERLNALKEFYKTLAIKNENAEIDEKTRINIIHLLNQQSQDGKGKGKGSKGKNDGDNQGNSDGDGNDKNDTTSEKKDGEDHVDKKQAAKFNQQNLTKEQAKQILESVSSEETNVKERKARSENKQKRKYFRNQDKQW